VTDLAALKAEARRAGFARRRAAHGQGLDAAAQERLARDLAPFAGRALAGYMPIRTEIDPLPVMSGWSGPVGVPVIDGPGLPLRFRAWRPGARLVPGPFGAAVPEDGAEILPEVLIVPLVAFDRTGARLGYGGGFYDRTLAILRSGGTVHAVGFAYAAQEAPSLPCEATDLRLDAIVTEAEVLRPRAADCPQRRT
jgi:5-formyltetrahydrofolate cyclo-ligase